MVIKYRDIKYPRIEYRTGVKVLILPHGYNHNKLNAKYSAWMKSTEDKIESALAATKGLRIREINVERLRKILEAEVKSSCAELGVAVKQIRLRKLTSKWASCSRYGNLTFNTDMKYLPPLLIKYIVLHEVVHIVERKHSNRFWNIVNDFYPKHRQYEKDLFGYWFLINKEKLIKGTL